MLAGAEWDVALLQECPPRFAAPLARSLRSGRAPRAHLAQLARRPAHRAGPRQPRPDRVRRGRLERDPRARASGLGAIVERARSGDPRRRTRAPRDRVRAHRVGRMRGQPARDQRPAGAGERGRAQGGAGGIGWAGDAPLLFGGDLNLRPARTPASSRCCASDSASWADRPRGDRPPAGAGPDGRRGARTLAGRAARAAPGRAARCASPTMPRSQATLRNG